MDVLFDISVLVIVTSLFELASNVLGALTANVALARSGTGVGSMALISEPLSCAI